MSLEQAIAENTTALRELLAALQSGTLTTQGTTEKKSQTTHAEKPAQPANTERTAPGAEAGASESKPANTRRSSKNSQPVADKGADQPAAGEVSRDQVAEAIKALAVQDRSRLIEVLAGHGAKHLNDVAAEDYAALLADLHAAQEEVAA
ncbi:hypothetical protein ABS755_07955 [Castellaniella sp. FW104-16D08]|uniref:hypothetical protein n=1 Tax=unclassified Castellaniella TaxID=2617606 RepID=UPI0033145216